MKSFYILLTLAYFAANAHAQCGEARWRVKTLQDTPIVKRPVASTVESLNALKRPAGSWSDLSRQGSETNVYSISGKIIMAGIEADNDMHLVLQGESGATMICEIPDPDNCPEVAATPYANKYRECREWISEHVGALHAIKKLRTPVDVTLVGFCFFDKISHGVGHAPNGVELHPVLSIEAN